MDQLLFYHYLNYQKEHNPSLAKRLSLLPRVACVLFFVTIACAIVGMVWLFRGATAKALIAVGIELASSEIFYHYMELYKIKTSKQRLIQRIDHWYDLRNWLKENSIQGYAAIETIRERITASVNDAKAERKEAGQRFDKWMQTLAIPVVLAIITSVVNQTNAFEVKLVNIFTIILVFALVCGLIRCWQNIKWFDCSQKAAQMAYFAEDLQGVLDLDNFCLSRDNMDSNTDAKSSTIKDPIDVPEN